MNLQQSHPLINDNAPPRKSIETICDEAIKYFSNTSYQSICKEYQDLRIGPRSLQGERLGGERSLTTQPHTQDNLFQTTKRLINRVCNASVSGELIYYVCKKTYVTRICYIETVHIGGQERVQAMVKIASSPNPICVHLFDLISHLNHNKKINLLAHLTVTLEDSQTHQIQVANMRRYPLVIELISYMCTPANDVDGKIITEFNCWLSKKTELFGVPITTGSTQKHFAYYALISDRITTGLVIICINSLLNCPDSILTESDCFSIMKNILTHIVKRNSSCKPSALKYFIEGYRQTINWSDSRPIEHIYHLMNQFICPHTHSPPTPRKQDSSDDSGNLSSPSKRRFVKPCDKCPHRIYHRVFKCVSVLLDNGMELPLESTSVIEAFARPYPKWYVATKYDAKLITLLREFYYCHQNSTLPLTFDKSLIHKMIYYYTISHQTTFDDDTRDIDYREIDVGDFTTGFNPDAIHHFDIDHSAIDNIVFMISKVSDNGNISSYVWESIFPLNQILPNYPKTIEDYELLHMFQFEWHFTLFRRLANMFQKDHVDDLYSSLYRCYRRFRHVIQNRKSDGSNQLFEYQGRLDYLRNKINTILDLNDPVNRIFSVSHTNLLSMTEVETYLEPYKYRVLFTLITLNIHGLLPIDLPIELVVEIFKCYLADTH
jgi:hypothetical protein